MNLWQSLLVALDGIKANKLRASLTMLGIIIGIASVIAVAAMGQGGRAMITKEFEKIGSNLFIIYVNWDTNKQRTPNDLLLADVEAIKNLVPEVGKITASSFSSATVTGDKGQQGVQLVGTLADYREIRNIEMSSGRFFNSEDVRGLRRVVVVEDALAKEIMGSPNVVGEKIYVNNIPLLVVGVIKIEQSIFSGPNQRSSIYVPFTFFQNITGLREIHQIEGKAANREVVDIALEKSLKIVERRHNQEPGFYQGISLEREMATANQVTGVITIIFGAVAGISLVVGGIGVMNIMLVSITERTREIGVRKALGARHKDIVHQFILEAMMICLIGGFIGMGLGIGGAYVIAKFAKLPPLISWHIIVIAVGFSVAVGLFFGIYPANKAARLDPVDALRYE